MWFILKNLDYGVISFCGEAPLSGLSWLAFSGWHRVHMDDLQRQSFIARTFDNIRKKRKYSIRSAFFLAPVPPAPGCGGVSQAIKESRFLLFQITIQNGVTAQLLCALHLYVVERRYDWALEASWCMDFCWLNRACTICCDSITAGPLPSPSKASCTSDSHRREGRGLGSIPQNVALYTAGTMAWVHPVSLVT